MLFKIANFITIPLQIIKRLEIDVEQKDLLVKKKEEEMKFFKLELINRENSYNKMFGANPIVGTIDPHASKK